MHCTLLWQRSRSVLPLPLRVLLARTSLRMDCHVRGTLVPQMAVVRRCRRAHWKSIRPPKLERGVCGESLGGRERVPGLGRGHRSRRTFHRFLVRPEVQRDSTDSTKPSGGCSENAHYISAPTTSETERVTKHFQPLCNMNQIVSQWSAAFTT